MRHMRIPVSWKEGNVLKAVRVKVVNLLRIMTVLWLIAHFTLTLIYVLPLNPVKLAWQPFLNATIGTYFPQNWNLFAPDPISADFALVVRPLSSDELKVAEAKGLPSDGWYDLSSLLWTKNQNDRFSAYERLSRPATKAILNYLDQPDQQPVQLMVKIASAFCKDIGRHNVSYVALVISQRQSKPWAERGTSKQPVVTTTFIGVYPIDKSVKNMHLYQI